jgi:hypothetical protein
MGDEQSGSFLGHELEHHGPADRGPHDAHLERALESRRAETAQGTATRQSAQSTQPIWQAFITEPRTAE